jgi:hypothetical protein
MQDNDYDFYIDRDLGSELLSTDVDGYEQITEVEFEQEQEFKFTVWKKYTIWEAEIHIVQAKTKESAEKKIIKDVEKDKGDYFQSCDLDQTTLEPIIPIDNQQMATVEIYDEENNVIYDNV